ncbi:LptF/LptG family permease [Flavobacteriaceae bacterium]|nr:LptF/LptG family permease [Flavobacteriaceae bacterium]
MKVLDRYIIKSFLLPFFATFFVVLFVFVMQLLWMAFDDIAGKGIDFIFILRFLFYSTLTLTPTALPVGVLLSSIMAMGNFSENYEFAATKSAGVSLLRILRPLTVMVLILSAVNFVFLNNVFPYASLKQKNLLLNIKKKKPSVALIEGVFNTEIPNYMIKFDRKYGEEENLLDNVLIYDLSGNRENNKIITAEHGKILSENGSRYMTLELENGNYFEAHYNTKASFQEKKKMPSSQANFDIYRVNIDISSLNDDNLESETWKNSHTMFSLQQLDQERDTLKLAYNDFLEAKARNILAETKGDDLKPKPDSLKVELAPEVLNNFDVANQVIILDNALNSVSNGIRIMDGYKNNYRQRRKNLNNFDYEYFHRVAFSLSCLVLFFIGAPLGSLIRKGGFGLPMIMAIVIFVIYYLINTFGKNLVEESSIPAVFGAWLSTLILLPAGLLLTRRAAKDKGVFNLDNYLKPFRTFFTKIAGLKRK